ncbi:hypothetical protein W97_09143 [Coniosporium apollinis CBS 100218]|uniref:Uncharacterized protein n=1 Tax=Coniosporium apollinis (strain CBS 100218) TaxID=1168221 RepID=R7Z785_CONA1|nr:uncharacterized protein W97_09143 [Coniosporium apollinis CBS 100218]EON69879.1 hypothetical protein W97_09143 [Coniosporium apollinis CBS 100218]
MAEVLPKIRLTDPHNKDSVPTSASPAQSPAKDNSSRNGKAIRPLSRAGDGRPMSSGRTSPANSQPPSNPPSTRGTSQAAPNSPPADMNGSEAAIDPLSEQIFKRTHTQPIIPQRTRPQQPEAATGHVPGQTADSSTDPRNPNDTGRGGDGGSAIPKDKKKGVSFLSRFIPNKKKGSVEGSNDNASEAGDSRPEGVDAQLFSQPIDNIEFSPKHPQPPAYIKVRSRFKKEKEFDRVFLAQELRRPTSSGGKRASSGSLPQAKANAPSDKLSIWAMEFSQDGKYLAAGGGDKVVRVWAVLSSPEDRRTHEMEEEAANGHAQEGAHHLNAPVFRTKPVREYEEHTSAILDLSWSKNNFLLSSSMDKTIRLWHVSRAECLCTFKHSDFVPSIRFHPRDDRFFLAGSLDSKLRLWSIPDKGVAFWTQLPDMITAVAFTPDGKTAIAGTLNGLCHFYETEGLKYQTQIHVRSAHGKNAKGSKITGIQAVNFPPDNHGGETKLLISSNDSRVRRYNFRDKSLEVKYKGHEDDHTQIRASFSDDARYVICGSEDRRVYIWSNGPVEGENRNQRPVEVFGAHASMTTVAVLAPTKTRQLLSSSEDPLYDLCNPPPVTLISRTESFRSSKAATETGSIQATPTPAETTFKRAEESPAYLARSAHPDGQIIVTADSSGCVKVFRQDCAWKKRRNESWDASSVFSKRMASGMVGRTTSTTTRGSDRSRSNSITTQPPGDRILSWRQGIASTTSLDNGSLQNNTRGNRSISPRKSAGQLSRGSSFGLRYDSSPALASPSTTDGPQLHTGASSPPKSRKKSSLSQQTSAAASPTKEEPPAMPSSQDNPLWAVGGQSNMFWNQNAWKEMFSGKKSQLELPPAMSKKASYVSTLSDEDSELSDNKEGAVGEADQEVKCRKCAGTTFKAKVLKGDGHALVCRSCGTAA